MNRVGEMTRAIRKARMPASAVVVFDTLANRCNYGSGKLTADYQPRSVAELARDAGIPERTTIRVLALLEKFGWLERTRPDELRRGVSTAYQPQIGRPRPERPAPLSGAERSRRWRARRSQRCQSSVTETAPQVASVPPGSDASRDGGTDEAAGPSRQSGTERHARLALVTTPVVRDDAQVSRVSPVSSKEEVSKSVENSASDDGPVCSVCWRPVSPLCAAQTTYRLGRILCSACQPDAFNSYPVTAAG
jgi:hypothetical protein